MTLVHNNAVLRTVMSLATMYYNYLGLRHKYLIKDPYCSVSIVGLLNVPPGQCLHVMYICRILYCILSDFSDFSLCMHILLCLWLRMLRNNK